MQLASIRRMGRSRWFSRVHPHLATADAALYHTTRGRLSSSTLGTGLQQLLLTTTGRRTGETRTVTLAWFPSTAGAYVVVGSNYGRPSPPAWSLNLLANPVATVEIRGRTAQVRARVTEGEEREQLWRQIVATWPAYSDYETRASGRAIRVFVLESAS